MEDEITTVFAKSNEVSKIKIAKMNKKIFDEGQKSLNRIRLLRKSTAQIVKNQCKKEIIDLKKHENKLIPNIANPLLFPSHRKIPSGTQKSSRCQSIAAYTRNKNISEQAEERRIERMNNEMKIRKQSQKEKRRNLKSAAVIRNSRQNTIMTKNAYFEKRIKQVRRDNLQKIQREKECCWQSYQKLRDLKHTELQTLKFWHQIKQEFEDNQQTQNLLK